jgi:predicted DNA-binding antitoxin AbrB/MazE fold protein
MSQEFDAIYEHGLLRPLTPLNLPESAEVTLVLRAAGQSPDSTTIADAPASDVAMSQQRAALSSLRAKMDSLPPGAPQDNLGGADHDRILYDWKK